MNSSPLDAFLQDAQELEELNLQQIPLTGNLAFLNLPHLKKQPIQPPQLSPLEQASH